MPSDFVREIISPKGSAVKETRLTLPDSLKQAIAESFERGKVASRDSSKKRDTEREAQEQTR
jgi:hypothetical protein